jgi:hypothetical protein
VIGTAPTVDTSVGVGPFRSSDKADAAWSELTTLGYNAEVIPLFRTSNLEPVTPEEE